MYNSKIFELFNKISVITFYSEEHFPFINNISYK